MKTLLSALLVITLSTVSTTAQETQTENTTRLGTAAPAPATIEEVRFLAGRWTGDGLGGRTEEIWSEPEAGVMLGTFRLLRDDKPVFYEFMTLSVTDRGLVMRLKHFNPDLTGWEEKNDVVEFRYVRTKENRVQFEGLTIQRDTDDRLTIFLAIKGRDGTVREEVFRMTRAR